MVNSENNVTFVNSTLKVTAKEEIDLNKELAYENESNKSIDQLLQDQNDKKED